MEQGILLSCIIIVTGAALFAAALLSLAKRRMTEPFCLIWGLISAMVILAGILVRQMPWTQDISGTGLILILIGAFCMIYGAFFTSVCVSELMRKNLELSMQVSLLLAEIEELKNEKDSHSD